MVGRTIGAGAMVTVIGSITGLLVAPAMAIEMLPEYTPTASLAGVMVTVRFPGVLPVAGETDSQPVPVVMLALAVNEDGTPLEVDTETVCAGGLEVPIWKLTGVRPVGLTTIVATCVTVSITMTVQVS